MKTLVLYYSLGGTTEKIARETAKALEADLSKLVCTRYRPGVPGFLRAGFDSIRGSLPEVRVDPETNPSDYDRLILCSPIWTGYLATPVRRFLRDAQGLPEKLGLAVTSGGHKNLAGAIKPIEERAGRPPEAICSITAADIRSDAAQDSVAEFAGKLTGNNVA